MYARLASKRRHFESGVVGKAVVAVVLHYITSLLYGVAFKRIGCFGYVCMAIDVAQRQHFKTIAKYGAYLVELVLVVGGEDQTQSPTPLPLPRREGSDVICGV